MLQDCNDRRASGNGDSHGTWNADAAAIQFQCADLSSADGASFARPGRPQRQLPVCSPSSP